MNERIENLEKKITLLEDQLREIRSYLSKEPLQTNPTISPNSAPHEPPIVSSISLPPLHRLVIESGTRDAKSFSELLPIVAVICFLLAGIFIVRLAMDSGWLTPLRQWGLLTLLGAALAIPGRWLERIDSGYRSYLSAAGSVLLYIAAYSSSLYFAIFPQPISLVMAMGVSAICLGLFHYHKNEIFPVLACVGTYLSPLLLGHREDLIFQTGFFVLWAFVFASMSNYLKTRTLSLTAAYLGIGVFTLLNVDQKEPGSLAIIIAVLVIQFLLFAGGVFLHSIRNKEPLSQKMAMAYLPILLFFYGTSYYFLDRLNPDLAPWISLGFAAVVYGFYTQARQILPTLESQELVGAFLAVVLIHSGYLQILPEQAKPWLLPTFLLLDFISKNRPAFPNMAPWISKIFMVVGAIEFAKISFSLITKSEVSDILPAVVTVFVGGFYYFKGSRHFGDKLILFLGGLHLLAVLALYRIADNLGSLGVSAVWVAYSVAILGLGYQRRDSALAKSSLLVLLISSLKALLYDASQAPSEVRILSLLLTGVVLYGSGYLFRKIKLWE